MQLSESGHDTAYDDETCAANEESRRVPFLVGSEGYNYAA